MATYGTATSNHIRVVANLAAAAGIPCVLIMPAGNRRDSFNYKMAELLGANIFSVPAFEVGGAIEQKLGELRTEGYKPYFIPGGGHGNTGTQAYVDAYGEIAGYEKENGCYFDYIFLASGTGATQAGLVCGQIQRRDKRKIIGISIARKNPRGGQVVRDSVKQYAHACGLNFPRMIINNAKGIQNERSMGSYKEGVYMMKYNDIKIAGPAGEENEKNKDRR